MKSSSLTCPPCPSGWKSSPSTSSGAAETRALSTWRSWRALSENFSGAEIENAVISALYDAFGAGRDLTQTDLVEALQHTVPLSRTMEPQIKALRQWARTHARPASAPARLGETAEGLRTLEL